jgi:heat shock protein HspQ
MEAVSVKFSVGQLVRHNRFGYRGVVVDVDPVFQGSESWYQQVALSRPPKDRPWYRVLVHDADHETYVAERHLEPDTSAAPVEHPLINVVFEAFREGRYVSHRRNN